MWLGTFDVETRLLLKACMDKGGVESDPAITEIEAAVEIFTVVRASPEPGRTSADQLKRIAKASDRLAHELAQLDEAGDDLLVERLMLNGHGPDAVVRLRITLEHLEKALSALEWDREQIAKPGRPPERARHMLLVDIHAALIRNRRKTRQAVLEQLAKQGLKAKPLTLPLEACARIVLRAVKEPVPRDLPKIVRAIRGKNLPEST